MSPPPLRLLSKAMREPYGDHVGEPSNECPSVTRCAGPPRAGIVYTSPWPVRKLSNAMLDPFGDHDGRASSAGLVVSRRTPPPIVATYRSPPPVAPLDNAISCGTAGTQVGSSSVDADEVTRV